MLRDVEELSTTETAETLGLTEENVKVRLHRGRALARKWLFSRVGADAKGAFPFMGARCDRVVGLVFGRIEKCEGLEKSRQVSSLVGAIFATDLECNSAG